MTRKRERKRGYEQGRGCCAICREESDRAGEEGIETGQRGHVKDRAAKPCTAIAGGNAVHVHAPHIFRCGRAQSFSNVRQQMQKCRKMLKKEDTKQKEQRKGLEQPPSRRRSRAASVCIDCGRVLRTGRAPWDFCIH